MLQRIKVIGDVRVAAEGRQYGEPAAKGQALLEQARRLLPEELREQVVGCVEKPAEMVLFARSAAWAGRLKLALAESPAPTDGRRVTVRILPRS